MDLSSEIHQACPAGGNSQANSVGGESNRDSRDTLPVHASVRGLLPDLNNRVWQAGPATNALKFLKPIRSQPRGVLPVIVGVAQRTMVPKGAGPRSELPGMSAAGPTQGSGAAAHESPGADCPAKAYVMSVRHLAAERRPRVVRMDTVRSRSLSIAALPKPEIATDGSPALAVRARESTEGGLSERVISRLTDEYQRLVGAAMRYLGAESRPPCDQAGVRQSPAPIDQGVCSIQATDTPGVTFSPPHPEMISMRPDRPLPHQRRIAFIGGGQMACGMMRGLVESGHDAARLSASHLDSACSDKAAALGAQVVADHQRAVDFGHVLVLAVEPEVLEDLLPRLKIPAGTLIVSLCEGVSVERIAQHTNSGQPIVRCALPSVSPDGDAVSHLYANSKTDIVDERVAENVLRTVGKVAWVDGEAALSTAVPQGDETG